MLLQTAPAVRDNFAEAYGRTSERALRPGVAARLMARVRWASLDQALIEGADPAGSPLLAARAARLTSTRNRAALAAGLERMVRRAQGSQRRWWDLARRETVLANSSELHALAALLSGSTPLYVRGVAMLERLLTDGTGATYGCSEARLGRELREARASMEG
jgi:hypothetical protein